NPRLMYAPVKEEVEWDEPGIIRYHDIISDREIEILKNISRPLLSRSLTTGGVSKNRTSQGVFLKEDNIVVARISQRIADITGLSQKSAENLFVQNYGIGGRYEPHYDELVTINGVLLGNKWVANKWIHEFGQEFRRRCSLSYWE
uniref:Prolyl 4-hydroxylase alpha subunit domain-containing protein n=1 Tax=Sinocyclocheilus grahami TaxID=75366 RepID=A0A672RP53_SINGR